MSAHIRFRATREQMQRLVANVITASGIDSPPPSTIHCLCELRAWHGRPVHWHCFERDGEYSFLHHDALPFSRRPWFSTYPTALAVVESVPGIEIIEVQTYDEWRKR